MLLPALNRAKLAADSAVCRSNLRQLTLGLNLYVQQEGAYPTWANGASTALTQYVGASFPEYNYVKANNSEGPGVITSYLGPPRSVFACPGYNRARGGFGDFFGGYAYNQLGNMGFNGIEWSFGLGSVAAMPGPPPGWIPPKRENQVVSPSDMIAIGDAVLMPNDATSKVGFFPWGLPVLGLAFEYPGCYTEIMLGTNDSIVHAYRVRHNARWNMGFCDGHVENLTPNDLFDLSKDNVARRWNIDHEPHNDNWRPPQ
jgi:prepilin-type processing-associated H-X9-DG protein